MHTLLAALLVLAADPPQAMTGSPAHPAPAASAPLAPAASVPVAPASALVAPAASAPAAPASVPVPPAPSPAAPPAPRFCSGDYADEFTALSEKARDFEQRQPAYTYCIRTSAVYECPSYAPDGSMRRTRRKVVAHGTGFGYRRDAGESLIVTNEHVAEWPAVTDDDHVAGDVPAGCKRVSDSLRIVDNEKDDYERDDVPLTRVVADPQLDIAVLRARVPLPVLPWKLGHSAALRERNAVDVRGFPLGVLRANNVGKVVSAYDHDEDRDWDHDDFVVDALLSPGNSGSPVFAISCTTGEFELVGVYHAGYSKGSALNVVVGIDQLRDLLTTLKRSPRTRRDGPASFDASDRAKLLDLVRADLEPLYFPFGSFTATARSRPDGALVFALMAKDFPLQANPALVLEDVPDPAGDAFGRAGRVWAGNRQGLREVERSDMDAETQASMSRVLDALRRSALLAGSYQSATRAGTSTREQFLGVRRLERAVRRAAGGYQDLSQGAMDTVERLCPPAADAPSTLADALAVPEPQPEATGLVIAPTALRAGPGDGAQRGEASQGWRVILVGGALGEPPLPLTISRP